MPKNGSEYTFWTQYPGDQGPGGPLDDTGGGYTATRMFFGTLAFWFIASMTAKEKVAGQDTFTWDKPAAAVLVLSGVYLVSMKRSFKKQ